MPQKRQREGMTGDVTSEDNPFGRVPGIRVGTRFESREACHDRQVHKQWIAGVSGQASVGAQSLAISGSAFYTENIDRGHQIVISGTGNRDLRPKNLRTSKVQVCHQEFKRGNKALLTSVQFGLPVRVIRSNKGDQPYSPTTSRFRYDGLYRGVKAWRQPGHQGFLVCRFLLERCDNEPTPWAVDGGGFSDQELQDLTRDSVGVVHLMGDNPAWVCENGIWQFAADCGPIM